MALSDRRVAVPWANLATHFLLPLPSENEMAVVEAGADGLSFEPMPASAGDVLYGLRLDGVEARTIESEGLQTNRSLLGAIANSLLMLGL